MPRASITMCGTSNIRRRNGRRSRAFRPGCGATPRCATFVDWLRAHNAPLTARSARVAFHGLDLYSLYDSIRAVLELSRRGRSGHGARRARALWLPDAMAVRSRDLRPCGADRRAIRPARRKSSVVLTRSPGTSTAPMPSMTASAFSTPCRMRGSSPMPSAITAPCITARAPRGICATRHMFETLKTLLALPRRRQQGDRLGAQFAYRQCRRRRKCPRAAKPISAQLCRQRFRPPRLCDRLRHG